MDFGCVYILRGFSEFGSAHTSYMMVILEAKRWRFKRGSSGMCVWGFWKTALSAAARQARSL